MKSCSGWKPYTAAWKIILISPNRNSAAGQWRRSNWPSTLGYMPILDGNSVELIARTEQFIDRLVADIDAAERHVHLLFYIFADDSTGRRVADALYRAVSAGREVPRAGRRRRLTSDVQTSGQGNDRSRC